MLLTALRLVDFRSYATVDLVLAQGATLFLGPNGQGKTNLLEAVEYVATLGSHRVSSDLPLVRSGCRRAVLQARVQAGPDDDRKLAVDLEIDLDHPNKARLNKGPVRPRDVVGALRVVLFAPSDLALAQGDPADRRGFLDALVTTRWPRLAGVRADFDRALRQRTALLKILSGRHGRFSAGAQAADTLEVWDERLADFGAEMTAARLATLADLAPRLAERHAMIAPVTSRAGAAYSSRAVPEWALGEGPQSVAEIADRYREEIARRRDDEIARGQSLVGPQRDDLALTLDGLPVKGYASHGESWSVALGLRLASLDVLREDGVEPVLLLDDVFAELDSTRRARLADVVAVTDQVLITAAVADDVPAGLVGEAFDVSAGTVRSRASGEVDSDVLEKGPGGERVANPAGIDTTVEDDGREEEA